MKYGKIVNGEMTFNQESLYIDWMGDDFEVNKSRMQEQGYKPVKELGNKQLYHDCDGEYTFEFVDKGDYIEEVAVYHKYPDEKLNQLIESRRKRAYSNNTDPLTLRKLRKQALGTWTDEDEAEYIEMIKKMSSDIDTGNPYIIEK